MVGNEKTTLLKSNPKMTLFKSRSPYVSMRLPYINNFQSFLLVLLWHTIADASI